jgi:hypothetical protein
MDDLKINQLSAFLAKGDIACGFIKNESIVKPRDELILERFKIYQNILSDVWAEISSNAAELNNEEIFSHLFISVKLVQADIESQFISIEPVLYDRDEMIKERLLVHFNALVNLM